MDKDIFLTYPVIIMRTGGLDGVALQAREYRHLLNKMDIGVHVVTGRCETKFSTVNPIGHQQTTVSRLDFYHPDSRKLFANQFEHGSETEEGVDIISDKEWLELFEIHKEKIKKGVCRVLDKVKRNTPVLIYNLVSLRHAHPAAAVALREIILENPNRAFMSHSADPDAERPEKIGRIKPFVLEKISAFGPEEPYSGGPYHMNNLYHIVLNPTQRDNFLNKYNIPQNHVIEIPDFLDFVSEKPVIKMAPSKIFMHFLAERCLRTKGDSYGYRHVRVTKDTVFFLSPVRPVYRKQLKEAMLVAREYGTVHNVDVAFVVTHPNTDDKQYFLESVEFSEKIGLPYYHLGKEFTLETLDSVYENMASLKTVGVIASSAGGWENALNEMARAGIPFYMNLHLNSYVPIIKEIGMRVHGADFKKIVPLVEKVEKGADYTPGQFADADEFRPIFAAVEEMLGRESRRTLVEHNYHKAYNYLSHDATLTRLVEGVNYIYKRHGDPRKEVKASTLDKIVHSYEQLP